MAHVLFQELSDQQVHLPRLGKSYKMTCGLGFNVAIEVDGGLDTGELGNREAFGIFSGGETEEWRSIRVGGQVSLGRYTIWRDICFEAVGLGNEILDLAISPTRQYDITTILGSLVRYQI
jgi:hypothetical protein